MSLLYIRLIALGRALQSFHPSRFLLTAGRISAKCKVMHPAMRAVAALVLFAWATFPHSTAAAPEDHLPNTALLTLQGDIASNLVAGVDRFLLNQLASSEDRRARHWHRDFSSTEAYEQSVATNRARLAQIIGARETVSTNWAEMDLGVLQPFSTETARFDCARFRLPAFGDVAVEGLRLQPDTSGPCPVVICIPDADVTPEQAIGMHPGVPEESRFPLRLLQRGCEVYVISLVDRTVNRRGNAKLTNREFLYRPAFELGRQLVGYDVIKVRAIVDMLEQHSSSSASKIGVFGHGEGGFVALCAAALDRRIQVAGVSGFFDDRRKVWQEPIDRNVFGLLDEFGDAEIASLIAPRTLLIEAARGPELKLKGEGGAPGHLRTPEIANVRREFDRAKSLIAGLTPQPKLELVVSGDGTGAYGSKQAIESFVETLKPLPASTNRSAGASVIKQTVAARQARQIHEIDRHNQALLTESPYVRQEFMKGLDTSSPEKYMESSARYREYFYEKVIGRFDLPLLPLNARTRLAYDKPKWTGYEVVLDVFPDVIAYGILLMPKDIEPGEKRPVVVCQHGLEGRAKDVVEGDSQYYHDFAARLAERGFITFAPQNLYIFTDRFRSLQRKANPLGKTLFSIITPQHQQILNWLKTLPNVDAGRIGFYGLSYGGKTAMRVPALLTDYALSICSADFNEWVWKNASTRSPYSYVWGGEYEIFEFDLGGTFNYAEMAALIAPRPFMVERGHFDGVAPDETVAYEFAKVQNLYEARLKLPPDRCQIEWFVGPHTINGKGTFDFLHHHLNWPKPQ